jgi:hypothetical protein
MDKLLLLIVGLLIVWLAITGKMGVFLASAFTPTRVKFKTEDLEITDTVSSQFTTNTVVGQITTPLEQKQKKLIDNVIPIQKDDAHNSLNARDNLIQGWFN